MSTRPDAAAYGAANAYAAAYDDPAADAAAVYASHAANAARYAAANAARAAAYAYAYAAGVPDVWASEFAWQTCELVRILELS